MKTKTFKPLLTKNQISLIFGTLLGDSAFLFDKRHTNTSYRLYFQHTNKKYFDYKIKIIKLN